ncbi:MAG: DUF4783 domain-containing protein [Bacteroidales bacterium]|nr:DUF4783 domain-containing protein [Bacteroidales bacterium]
MNYFNPHISKTKKIILSLIFGIIFLFGSNVTFAEIPPKIFEAIQTANTDELVKYLNSSVELVILEKDDVYSKQQSSIILKNFFAKNAIKTFSIVHQGGKEDAQYAICKIESTSGKSFRVYFLVKNENNKYLIHQLRIAEE